MAFSIFNLSVFAGIPLRRGTVVVVRTQSELTSKDGTGNLNAFVDSDVKAEDGTILISRGTPVTAVVDVKKAKGVGKPGEINISSMTTTSVDGQSIVLNGSMNVKGQSKKGTALGLSLGLTFGLGLLPCLACLAIKGGQATVPAGTVISNFTTAGEYQVNK